MSESKWNVFDQQYGQNNVDDYDEQIKEHITLKCNYATKYKKKKDSNGWAIYHGNDANKVYKLSMESIKTQVK